VKLIHITENSYQTSDDYSTLWALVKTQSVVCFVDYGGCCRDICDTMTKYHDNGKLYAVEIGVRGMCNVCAETWDQFNAQCKRLNLRFIEPATPAQPNERNT
jgi:hypothetical protein